MMRKASIWQVRFRGGCGGPRGTTYWVEASSIARAVERAEVEFDRDHPEAERGGSILESRFWGEVLVEEGTEF